MKTKRTLFLGACPRIGNLFQKSWICAISRFFSANSGAILLKKSKNSPKPIFPSLRFLFSDKLLAMTLLVFVLNASARRPKEPTIQQRLASLEQKFQQQTSSSNNISDFVMQIEALQQQIARLEGVIEEQNHQIKALKEKQKLWYIDTDSRLSALESGTQSTQATNDLSGSQNSHETSPDSNDNTATNNSNTNPPLNNSTNNSTNGQNLQSDYDVAFAHLRAGRYLESARGFEAFIHNHPQNELTDNAYYWLGESYYVKRQYPQALAAFQSLTSKFPASEKVADSWLKIGYCYFELDDMDKAETTLEDVIRKYPNTSIARLAKTRIRQIQRDH